MDQKENSSACGQNILQAHAFFEEETLSLNGSWRILYCKGNQPIPDDAVQAADSAQSWEKQMVPAVLKEPEYIPAFSGGRRTAQTGSAGQVAIYRRSFRVPSQWQGRPVMLRLTDVREAVQVWLNGHRIGTCTNPMHITEMELTEFLQPEKNLLVLAVSQYSDLTPVRCSSQWYRWGLCGNVELYSLPAQRIEDVFVQSRFQPDHSVQSLSVEVRTRHGEGLMIRAAVLEDSRVAYYGDGKIKQDRVTVEIPCPGAALWSETHPKLYRLALILTDGVGIYHTRQLKFGLRQVELDACGLRLNGEPTLLSGVNYRPFAPDEAGIRRDLARLRSCGFRAVRVQTVLPEFFYEICDEIGFLVLDGCGNPAAAPWTDAIRETERNLILSHRNHCSVLAWAVQSSRADLENPDPSRLLEPECVTMENPELSRLEQLVRHEDLEERGSGLFGLLPSKTIISANSYCQKPFLISSLGTAHGNCAPDLGKITDLMRKHPQLWGAFLCNDTDQTQSGRWPAEGMTGLFRENQEPHDVLYEIMHSLQPLTFERENSAVRITNWDRQHNLEDYRICYTLTRDGQTEEEHTIAVSGGYGESALAESRFQAPIFRSGQYALHIRAFLGDAEMPAAQQCWEYQSIPDIREDNPGGSIRDDGNHAVLRTDRVSYSINRSTGNLDQITVDGDPLLTSPLAAVFCRPRTAMDQTRKQLEEWEKLTLRKKLPRPSVFEVDHMTRCVVVSQNIGSGLMRTYRLYSSGALELELRLRTGKTAPSRIGLQGGFPTAFSEFDWQGLGPRDTYSDRMSGAVYGCHHLRIDQTGDCYPDCSEWGNKMRVHRLSLCREDGKGLRVICREGMNAGVRRWNLDQLFRVSSSAELPEATESVLNLDVIQNGLETVSIVPHTTYLFRIILEPII